MRCASLLNLSVGSSSPSGQAGLTCPERLHHTSDDVTSLVAQMRPARSAMRHLQALAELAPCTAALGLPRRCFTEDWPSSRPGTGRISQTPPDTSSPMSAEDNKASGKAADLRHRGANTDTSPSPDVASGVPSNRATANASPVPFVLHRFAPREGFSRGKRRGA